MEPQKEIVKENILSPLRKVTPLSKYLALALFVALPFIGSLVGYTFSPVKVVEVEKIIYRDKSLNAPQQIQDSLMSDKSSKTDVSQWKTYVDSSSSISFRYPEQWIIETGFPKDNKQVTFEKNYITVSFDYLDQSVDLEKWLRVNNFFDNNFQKYQYTKDAAGGGFVDVYVLTSNDSFDVAFVHTDNTIFYIRNGVNEHTGVDNVLFFDFTKYLATAENTNLREPLDIEVCGGNSILDTKLFSNLYFKDNDVVPYVKKPDVKPWILSDSTVCPLENNDTLISFSYMDKNEHIQAVSRMSDREIKQTYRGKICDYASDYGSARLFKVSNGEAIFYCLSRDGSEMGFQVAKLNIATFDLKKVEWNSPEEAITFNEVTEAYSAQEDWKEYGYPR